MWFFFEIFEKRQTNTRKNIIIQPVTTASSGKHDNGKYVDVKIYTDNRMHLYNMIITEI